MARDELTPEQERELDRLLALANLQRMRGQWADAAETCRKATEIAPKDLTAREMYADVLYECGKLDEALNEYKQAMEIAPGRESVEKKHAKLILEVSEQEYEKALAKAMLENPHLYTKRERKPGLALLLAAVLPGLGQFYNQEFLKAGIIFGSFLLFIIAWSTLPHPSDSVLSVQDLIRLTNPVVLVLGFLSLSAYIYGLVDAPLSAEKSSKAAKKQMEV